MTQPPKSMTRKEFLRTGALDLLRSVAQAVRSAAPSALALVPSRRVARPVRPAPLRPPGAAKEVDFQALCTRCDDCLRACPHWVIRKAGPELGPRLAGTPVIVPQDNPCLMCTGFPCAAACTTGALNMPAARPRIGVAVVDPRTCFSALGQPCDYCAVSCPERPRAIGKIERGVLPDVNPDRCTGCGICAQLCPARAIGVSDVRGPGGSA